MVYSVLEFWLKPSAVKGKEGGVELNIFFLFSAVGFLFYVALKHYLNVDAQE